MRRGRGMLSTPSAYDMSPKKDWQLGIDPTPAELTAQVARVRTYVEDCSAIVDELFPESAAKPLPAKPVPYRMFPWGGYIPPGADERREEEVPDVVL